MRECLNRFGLLCDCKQIQHAKIVSPKCVMQMIIKIDTSCHIEDDVNFSQNDSPIVFTEAQAFFLEISFERLDFLAPFGPQLRFNLEQRPKQLRLEDISYSLFR